MKKLLLLFVLIASTLLVSCEKEDSLDGTTWRYDGSDEKNSLSLTFQKSTFSMEVKWTEDGVLDSETLDGTYIYTPPTLKLTTGGETATATISGNKMTDNEGDIWTKQ